MWTRCAGRSALLTGFARPQDGRMQVDLITTLVLLVGVTAAALVAILVGKLSARVFFHASSRRVDEDEAA
jgi:hypothetical protein